MSKPNYLLRGVLVLIGLVVIALGLNVGLGGILTLGWQGGTAPFLTITDPALFAVRDSHVRFIGGVWLAAGLLLLAGGFQLARLRTVLIALTAMVFVGGLARFSGDFAVLLQPAVAMSLGLELVGFPLLGWWVSRAERA
jgi:hypothetical protein